MLKGIIKRKPTLLDEQITAVLEEMALVGVGTDKYTPLIGELERLVRLRNEGSADRVSPDTLAVVGGNLLGIIIIVCYERVNVITTRALSMLREVKLH